MMGSPLKIGCKDNLIIPKGECFAQKKIERIAENNVVGFIKDGEYDR